MKSLKQTYDTEVCAKPEGDRDYYPTLYLDGKQIDALGVDRARVDDELMLTLAVRVASTSETKGGSRSLTLEAIEGEAKPKAGARDASSVLFPNERRA